MTFVDPQMMEKPRKRRKRPYYKTVDDLFSKVVRRRGNCVRCLSTHRLQCAHIVSRRYRATRWDLDNAVCLCAKCHTYFTHRPLEWDQWIGPRLRPGALIDLKRKAIAGRKWSQDELEELAASFREKLAT